jgi:tetratricopeptide (TPR) repeat protein
MLTLPSAIETCRLASALSPGAAMPIRELALAEVEAGDVRGALASFDACLRASPLATSCIAPLFQLQAFEGDCNAALASARRLVSADPESPEAYDSLAEALLGSGQSVESVRDALDAAIARHPPSDALLVKQEDEARLAIRIGDFTHARDTLRAWDDALGTSRVERDHLNVTENRVFLAIEEGRTSDAKALATTYLDRRAAWSTSDGKDYSIVLYGLLYRVGAITKQELARRRATWLAWTKTKTTTDGRAFSWVYAYADPALDAEDAREALDALPGYLPLPDPIDRAPDIEYPIGEVYRLAGRESEALPYLTRAAKACVGMEAPFEPTWASLALGQSLEKLGDRREACSSYALVVSRWKVARTSLSARLAEGRFQALGCSH